MLGSGRGGWGGGRRGLFGLGKGGFDEVDAGVVTAITVVGFGEGVNFEEADEEVIVEGQQGVLGVFVELPPD